MIMLEKVFARLPQSRSILLSLPTAFTQHRPLSILPCSSRCRISRRITRNVHNTAILASGSSGSPKMVPEVPSAQENPNNIQQLVHHLERTSLVDFESAEAVNRLTEAVNFADQLFEVNTEGVEPLVTVLENESLYLRDDTPEPTRRQDILKNASVTEEDYFVAPPGNIPLEPASKNFLKDER